MEILNKFDVDRKEKEKGRDTGYIKGKKFG